MKKLIILTFLSLSILVGNVTADITTGLVAHYEFENNTTDSSVNAFDLTAAANPLYVPGKKGQAYSFNGTDNYLSALQTGLSDDNGTIAYWIKTDAPATRSMVILGTSTVSADTFMNGADFVVNGVNTAAFTNTVSINDNTWHHIVVSFAGVNTTKVYIDGSFVAEDTTSGDNLNLDTNISIGHWNGSVQYADTIDEVRIYNRTLTADDVTQLYENVPTVMANVHGGAVQFDGNSSYIKVADNSALDSISSSITLEAWVNISEITTTKTIVRQYDFDNNDRSFTLSVLGDKVRFILSSDGTFATGLDSTTPLSINTWVHIVGAFDGTTMRIYINGAEDANVAAGFSTINNSTDKLYIGAAIATAGIQEQMNGQIDEVRIWNTSQTAEDIKRLMNHQLDGTETGLVAYYNFDERIGTIAKDITGNGNDGTLDINATRVNFLGNSILFDGAGAGTIGDDDLEGLLEFTVHAWINNTAISAATQKILDKDFVATLDIITSTRNVVAAVGDGVDWNSTCTSTQSLDINRWYSVASTFSDAKDEISIYINGVLDKTCTGMTTYMGNNANARMIGANSSSSEKFTGNIAEVSMWAKELNLSEIQKLMASSLTGAENSLISYWPLNEGNGATAFNYAFSTVAALSGYTWTKSAPLIYGDKIYTTDNIHTFQGLVVENNTTIPTYSYNGGVPATIGTFNPFGLGGFTYTANGNETLDINAVENSANLNTQFQVISYANPISITINLANVNLTDYNITAIKVVGQDGNSENLVIDPTYIYANGTNTITSTIANLDQNISISVDTNTSGINKTWWFSFSDGKLYEYNDSSLKFKTTVGYIVDTFNFDASTSGFVVDPLSISPIYNHYRHPNFAAFSISFDVNGTSGNNINVVPNTIGSSVAISTPPQTPVPANTQVTLSINNIDATTVGNTLFAIVITDTATGLNRARNFLINVSDEYGVISVKETSGTTATHTTSFSGDLYMFNAEYEKYNDVEMIDIDKIKVVSSLFSKFRSITDKNGTVSVESKANDMNGTFAYDEDANLVDYTTLTTLYNSVFGTSFTFATPTSSARKVFVSQSADYLRVNYPAEDLNGNNYSSLSDFMFSRTAGGHPYGLMRNHTRDNLILINSTNLANDIAARFGSWYEVTDCGVATGTTGSWIIDIINSKEVLIVDSTIASDSGGINSYYQETAFIMDNGVVNNGEYIAAGDEYSYLFLNKDAKNDLYNSFDTNPRLEVKVPSGYSYISLENNESLCSASTQASYASCDKNNTLESVFGSDTLLKYEENWQYWDSSALNSGYGLNKFSIISPTDGVLVNTTDTNRTLLIPFNDDVNQTNDYVGMSIGKWYLLSNNSNQLVSEIVTSVSALSPARTISYILVFRNSAWHVYAPFNDAEIDPAILRLSTIKRGESYWILLR